MSETTAVDAALLDEIRRLNVVLHEDDETITAVSPCPTAAHRPEKVAPAYVVDFACPHGTSTHVFCVPCTADRRAGRYACLGRWTDDGAADDCPGAVAVAVATLHPVTRSKPPS